nr:unnamed protein product [Haemonchus contortus]
MVPVAWAPPGRQAKPRRRPQKRDRALGSALRQIRKDLQKTEGEEHSRNRSGSPVSAEDEKQEVATDPQDEEQEAAADHQDEDQEATSYHKTEDLEARTLPARA